MRGRRLIGLFLTIFVSILHNYNSTTAFAVEDGQIIKEDPNVVYAGDGTINGFLYSPWLIFMQAHSSNEWFTSNMIFKTIDGQESHAERILIANGYRDRVVNSEAINNGTAIADRVNDFSIIVLSEPLIVKNRVRLLKPEEVNGIIEKKTPIRMIGMSRHDATQVIDGVPRILEGKLIKPEDAKIIFDKYYLNGNEYWAPKGAKYTLGPINLVLSPGSGHGCDGDSGAGYFIQDGEEKIYIGPNGSHSVGVPNCGRPAVWGEYGNVQNIEPAYNHLDLITQAEEIASQKDLNWKAQLEAEAKAKAEAEAKAPLLKKVTIICIKGKSVKKIAGFKPKCPLGYKQK